MKKIFSIYILCCCLACQSDDRQYKSEESTGDVSFQVHVGNDLGVDFRNDLKLSVDLNIFKYLYFYNGGGVGLADYNDDGLTDIFLTANQGPDQLYINRGDLQFDNVTAASGITHADSSWSTGVSVVDINQDGHMDIYVSRVSDYEYLSHPNALWVYVGKSDEGVPQYENQASKYGLDLRGFCTQSLFFDYDRDGDLDVYVMKHSIHDNGTFGQRFTFDGNSHPQSGDLLLRRDGDGFTDVTSNAGIYSSVIGYGLGIASGDVNNDGWPDIYIGNDFHENDYLYINQQDGTFSEELTSSISHTSRFSMGVDIADVTGDGWSEIMSLDMLPEDPTILKSSEGEDALNIFRFKLGYGYNHQYARNALQLNNRNGTFSDIAPLAGVEATDWSWSVLIDDYNADGLKDIFISNGIPKRMNDIDYINFMKNDEVQFKIQTDNMEASDLDIINKLPEIRLKNKIYENQGDLQFLDAEPSIASDYENYSNGAAVADLDGDGDLDIVANVIDDYPVIYENTSARTHPVTTLTLRGKEGNLQAYGTRVIVGSSESIIESSLNPVRGFQSSMTGPLYLAIPSKDFPATAAVHWPDGMISVIDLDSAGAYVIDQRVSYPTSDRFTGLPASQSDDFLQDVTSALGVEWSHMENDFVEFLSEPLLPHMTSTEGPAIAVADFNGDGKEDFYVSSAKHSRGVLYFQVDGAFVRKDADFLADTIMEETAVLAHDVDDDGDEDLVLGAGGSEWALHHRNSRSRILLNDGTGIFTEQIGALSMVQASISDIAALDVTGDEKAELILGARSLPRNYGDMPQSYILQRQEDGSYIDVSESLDEKWSSIGMVKDLQVDDVDGDGADDLLVALEWGHVIAYKSPGFSINSNKSDSQLPTWDKIVLTDRRGWWNTIIPTDIDNDGDRDYIVGNLGLNSRLSATVEEPLTLYRADFDNNGQKEQIMSYFVKNRELPFSNKMELESQMPSLKKRYLYASEFAKADMKDLWSHDLMDRADTWVAECLAHVVLRNEGDGNWTQIELPRETQHSVLWSGVSLDINGDDRLDIFPGYNYYDANVQLGRYDADWGSVLLQDDEDGYKRVPLADRIAGQVRDMEFISVGGVRHIILARNGESLKIIKLAKHQN